MLPANRQRYVVLLLTCILFLAGCKSIGLMSDNNSWLPESIDTVGEFFKAYIVVQLSILLVGFLLGLFLGRLGNLVALVLHFIWIVSARDYGFWTVLLLFGLFSVISLGVSMLTAVVRNGD